MDRATLPSVGANETKIWQPVNPQDDPDHRLSAMIIKYHALISEPKKS